MALININTALSPEYLTTFNQTAVNPVANPIYWVFNTDGSGQPNAKAQLILRFGNLGLPAGDSLVISRFNGTSSFVSRVNPSLYEFNASLSAISNALPFSQMLANHPEFKPYYTVVWSEVGLFQYVTITARFAGAQYDLGATVNLTNAGSIFPVVTQTGSTSTQGGNLTDFTIKLKLFVNRSLAAKVGLTFALPFTANDWEEQLVLLQAEYTSQNIMAIDLQQALQPFVNCPPPNINSFTIYTVQDCLVKYYFEYYASYVPDGENSPRDFYVGSIGNERFGPKLYAASSGMPTYTQPVKIHGTYKYFWHRLTTADKVNFLTGCPPEKVTNIDAYEFLYWFWYDLGKARGTLLALRYNFYFEDGTELLNQDTVYVNTARYTVHTAQVGYAKIRQSFGDIETTQGSLLRAFDVTVIEKPVAGVANTVTLPQTFLMDNTTRCRNFDAVQLLFRNPYGGFDEMRFGGYYTKEVKTTAKAYEKNPTWVSNQTASNSFLLDQLPIDNDIRAYVDTPDLLANRLSPKGLSTANNYESTNETRFTLNSGWIRAIDLEWLMASLFVCNEAYLVAWADPQNLGDPNQRLIRRVVFEDRTVQRNQFDDTFNVQITVKAGLPLNAING